jgi:hypothetical protein
MRLLLSSIFIIYLGHPVAYGQQVENKYLEFVYGEKSKEINTHKVNIVVGEIEVSKRKPLIIKSPDVSKKWNVYTFNQIFDNGTYKIFISGLDDAFKPKLVVLGKDSLQVDELQLIGDTTFMKMNSNRMVEEVIIRTQDDITHSVIFFDKESKPKKVKSSKMVRRFRITNLGKIELIQD